METFLPQEIERKWQAVWEERETFKPQGPPNREGKKFFLIFAYPGVSGYLHVGHMRGFTYADVITRFKRATGHDVLFPVGFHATGIPAIALAKKIERGDVKTIDYLVNNGCPKDIVHTLKDVDKLIDFFSHVYIEDYWKRFGFGMDYSRCMSTISDGYNRFITWQFHKLHQKKLLITKPHHAPFCPGCGPVAVDSSMTDIAQGGGAETQEFTALKFRLKDGTVLPAATLRPETVFGVTNMWLHPDVEYVKAAVLYETWIVSREAFDKLRYQMDGRGDVKELETLKGARLIGSTCTTPMGREVPILPGTFVDPKVATGVVMSVPAHAPFDRVALKDVQSELSAGKNPYDLDENMVRSLEPITMIQTGSELVEDPAGILCTRMGIKNQSEADRLDEATKIIYKNEFHSGALTDICQEYSGLKVSRIKETLRVDLIEKGLADVFFEFSEPVICRCGNAVVIKRIPDQWFISYSDPDLTRRAKEHAATMDIYPEEYMRDIGPVLDWFGDRACIRKGSWLGTEFPYKKDWIIEPISDSTLYPSYYIVSKYLNEGTLKLEWMDDALFDHVFLGKGDIEGFDPERRDVIQSCRRDFLYWYPLDINLGGKEHKTVHFPVFLMNHVAIMEPEHWPRGLFVHWWVTMSGGDKISKTKGGAEPIPDAIREYGVDAMRLYYCHVGSANMDVEWQKDTVSHYRARMRRIHEQIDELLSLKEGGPSEMDSWLLSIMNQRLSEVTEHLERGSLREASNIIYFTIPSDLKWYTRRGGRSQSTLRDMLGIWVQMLQPFTPHLAEEIWKRIGGEGLVSTHPWPHIEEAETNISSLKVEEYVIKLLEDLNRVKKITDMEPNRIILYTSSAWKWTVLEKLMDMADASDGRINPGDAIKALMAVEDLGTYRKMIPKLVGRLSKDVVKMGPEERDRYKLLRDEMERLENLSSFLSEEMGCEVKVYSEEDGDKEDPMGKSKASLPLKPAIFME